MARALDTILAELNQVYNPQRDVIKQQQATLDPMQEAETKGLEAAKNDAFSQITDQANRRGLFYSGIPVAEEQRYTGSTFLPAVANLKSRYAQQRFNLQDALAKLTSEQYLKGQDIYQSELNRDAASSGGGGGASPSFGSFGGGGDGAVLGAQVGMSQRTGGGFNFFDSNGNPLSAAQYSQATGKPFRQLLQEMANAGDKGAAKALGFVGNDYNYDPTKIGNDGAIYNALLGGLWGRKYQAPQQTAPKTPQGSPGRTPWGPRNGPWVPGYGTRR